MIKIGDKNLPLVMNASGCWVLHPQQIESIAITNKCVISKTCTLNPKPSNPLPNFIEYGNYSLNCKGLPNLGYITYKKLWLDYYKKNIVLVLSLDCSDLNDLSIMLQDFNHYIEKAKIDTNDHSKELVELNISCPNKNTNQRIIGYDFKYLDKILNIIKDLDLKNIDIGLKLPPYIDKYLVEQLTALLIIYQSIIAYIVCSNSLPNCSSFNNGEYKLSMNIGSLSGELLKCIALSNVDQFSKLLTDYDIKIIGCGGISNVKDINDYLKVGANGVQIGRALYLNGVDKLFELNNNYIKKSKL